ncbi:hypothetical protein FVE85_3857 [Porphyridium purpureum]|uniref:C2H2-type domain-containing protein n=1 Tax=Porphyridium purpureum TaxID=35688 RepID=A0A5J4YGL9_PORPP|nr:hypothetical protein FVE85_3857 [Porphyridium purpureum]|eukprot:POR5374..scf252_46
MGTGDGPSAAGAGAGASHLQPAMPVVEQVHGTLRANTDPKRAAALPLSQSQSPTAAVRAPKRVCTVTEHSGSEDESEEDVPLSQPSQGFTCPVAACSHTCFDAKQFGWHLRTAHSQQEQAAVPAHCYADCGLGPLLHRQSPTPPLPLQRSPCCLRAARPRSETLHVRPVWGTMLDSGENDSAATHAGQSEQHGASTRDGTLDQQWAGGVGSPRGQAVSMRRVTRSQTQARQAVSNPAADPAAREADPDLAANAPVDRVARRDRLVRSCTSRRWSRAVDRGAAAVVASHDTRTAGEEADEEASGPDPVHVRAETAGRRQHARRDQRRQSRARCLPPTGPACSHLPTPAGSRSPLGSHALGRPASREQLEAMGLVGNALATQL